MQELIRWLWAGRSISSRLARATLVPAAVFYRAASALRVAAYRRRWIEQRIPSVPTIAVGNLTVGGSGKTPIASWIASYYARRGVRPGIVLRGYGGDEGDVHRQRTPEAVVVEDPDRLAAADSAIVRGAAVVILDDAYQRLDVGRDLNIAVVSAESLTAARWTLPAGPWREPLQALDRADLVVVTRKRATLEAARFGAVALQAWAPGAGIALAHLSVGGFHGLLSERPVPARDLDGARVLAGAGIADPYAFGDQCAQLGAVVQLHPFHDHQAFGEGEVRSLLHAARRVDYVVVTQKDAVKLRSRWPADAPEPLVADLAVQWEYGRERVEAALDAAAAEATGFLASDHHA
jgi:tetraacyldisaccharide 4'-kinase